jgi:hypothetical protein
MDGIPERQPFADGCASVRMRPVLRYLHAIVALVLLCTAGCNCNGNRFCELATSSSTTTTTTTTTGSAAGIWNGTDSSTGLQLTGLINSDGQATFYRSDGVQFVGTSQVNATALTIPLTGYTQFGYQFPDGSTSGSGSFSGTVTSGATISGSLQFTTTNNTAIDSTWSLTFNSLYNNPSSLSTISGNYTDSSAAVTNGLDPLTGSSVTVSSAGVLFAQGSTNSCVLNGTITVTNASYNLYQVSYSLANCTGQYAVLNGVQFSGMAQFNSTVSPEKLIMAVTGTGSSAQNYGIVSQLSLG